MAWTDFGSNPANIGDIRSQSFEHPMFIAFLFRGFFDRFYENIEATGGILILSAIIALILRAIFDGAFLPWFVFCSLVFLAIFIIWEYKDYCRANNRLDSEYRLIKNYHLFYCKQGFYNSIVTKALATANNRNEMVIENLYNQATVFVNDYIHNAGEYTGHKIANNTYINPLEPRVPNSMYESNCPLELASLLRDELRRYIDANVNEIIGIANRYITDTYMSHGLDKGIMVLKLAEGNTVINTLLSTLNSCLPNSRGERMLNSNAFNKEMLDSIYSYDNQITIDLFNEEYRNFENIASSRSPANILSLLSPDSYILFLWYFAVKGIKDLYDKTARMLRYFYSYNIEMELAVSESVCNQCHKMADRNASELGDPDTIRRIIERYRL